MQEKWEYIEAYFMQALDSEERKTFELRCTQEEAFAKEVAFYLTARSAARDVLIEEKERSFTAGDLVADNVSTAAPVRKMILRKWLPYAVAACVIFIVALFFFIQPNSPQQFATNYIQDKYVKEKIGISMDASRDSMQLGIEAYNTGDYKRAQFLFDGVRHNDNTNSDAIKFAGLAFLLDKNYDKALQCFEELAAMKNLYSNGGDILTAATLLQRNMPGDKDKAKQLLQKVVKMQEEGSRQAQEWLQKW